MNDYCNITDISFINSNSKTYEDYNALFLNGLFSNKEAWNNYALSDDIKDLGSSINSRLRNRMSQMSLGIFNAIENGPGKNIESDEEIYLFTGFGEIETTNIIIKNITLDKHNVVSPTLFHNSVHHTSLGYYTIIKNIHNPCFCVSDGLATNFSFINLLSLRAKINKSFVVSAGEEYSGFYSMDRTRSIKIAPSFASYRIIPGSKNGFRFLGEFNNLDDLKKQKVFIEADNIFANKGLFLELNSITNKKTFTEFPVVQDNPCAIINRLAFPFYFNIKGRSLVLERHLEKIYCFEVNI